jgi:hypothetical protein
MKFVTPILSERASGGIQPCKFRITLQVVRGIRVINGLKTSKRRLQPGRLSAFLNLSILTDRTAPG